MHSEHPPPGRLAGTVAIVSGAARGIGEAIVRCFVEEGARVVVGDLLKDEGNVVAEELGDGARFVHLDVRNPADWDEAVTLATTAFGLGPTVLVHNAGVMAAGTVEGCTPTALRESFDVNVLGPVIGTQAVLRSMIGAGGGSIIIVSSIVSVAGGAGFVPYAVSKAGSAAYARCAALELGQYGIRVNSLHPGGVKTPMNSGPNFAALDEADWFGRMPIPRMGRPAEIAQSALYLASEQSSFVTGTQLIVDGGQVHGERGSWRSWVR
jgi:3alpha(or 20beta)-hydroxysteroid dehydrogenase